MPELIAHVMTAGETNPETVAAELRRFLSERPEAGEASVEVEQPRLGLAEILTIVQITKGAVDLIGMLIEYVKEHRSQIKGIEIELDGHRVPVDRLTPEQRVRVLEALEPS